VTTALFALVHDNRSLDDANKPAIAAEADRAFGGRDSSSAFALTSCMGGGVGGTRASDGAWRP
jgi:hypothetical protein